MRCQAVNGQVQGVSSQIRLVQDLAFYAESGVIPAVP